MEKGDKTTIKRRMNSKTLFYLALVLGILSVVAYFLWDYVNNRPLKLEKSDVMMAQDCGMDGLQCCSNEPKCSYGQECCVDVNDSRRNQCADKCGCGKSEEFCCANNQCDAGFACENSKCTACGGLGQPCCGASCSGKDAAGNQLACFQGKCTGCGVIGNPCCDNNLCFGRNQPEKSLAECKSGICESCGGNQQSACGVMPKCLDGYLLNNGNCFKCGDINEPCCENKKCDSKSKLKCSMGFCQ